ncbi:MiaB/RimO family radical SAM methylthiotransferase [Desulfovibrio inopinatus]|uniref:MiaB/RimO family radical SAM methylthiotransferase n=1 Tax=Desulfovibrio inopinatus TaxID=102109 RepID=UPI0004232A71|nr:MiaB/RimO family radical SAM methylthiotransferase [Desulfovibrio inopinatus]
MPQCSVIDEENADSSTAFRIFTLGCKINQYESQAVHQALVARGAHEAENGESPSLVVINSCAVTAKAVADSRQLVRRVARDWPDATILVSGCAAQTTPEMFCAKALDIDDSFPDRIQVMDQCAKAELAGEHQIIMGPLTAFGRSRPVVKVQDGCIQHCSYCIVPLARSSLASKPADAVISEVRQLFLAGYGEVILSGINLRLYGYDKPERSDFFHLLAEVDATLAPEFAGRSRIRLSSLDPAQLTESALDILAGSRLVTPHLHLSMQSADRDVLRAMGRGHYSPQKILERLHDVTAFWPVFALGADFLVGFPGETDDMFDRTLKTVMDMPLTYAHVFPYSKRPGTRAATFSGQVSASVKKTRAAALRRVAADAKVAFIRRVASMSHLTMAVERTAPVHGVCEYYVECAMSQDIQLKGSECAGLISVTPLTATDNSILVQPEESVSSSGSDV